MTKESIDDDSFCILLNRISQETDHTENKVKILYDFKGFLNAYQATKVMHALGNPGHKVQAIQILETKLCRMSCQDARHIFGAMTIQRDKLIALDCTKRVLTDYHTRMGEEYILSCFPFEADKHQALQILRTVRSDIADIPAAGSHQGYAALGALYTQSFSSVPGTKFKSPTPFSHPAPHEPDTIRSIYPNHPSYAYPKDKSYAEDRGYPGHIMYPSNIATPRPYPSGAPYLGQHSGAPAPTGFPNLDKSRIVY
ncbi:uncharacterized protein LOC121388685 [Gigantopelta aegis]|uniref:uncharacterized protein LOC121388685 n=1 Tax=Gigantopelta aegis TaxID=1735272 RepID=UPI001B88B750|nr:uncharacterized protein LOC121388685 [Gigantopelta aegis]